MRICEFYRYDHINFRIGKTKKVENAAGSVLVKPIEFGKVTGKYGDCLLVDASRSGVRRCKDCGLKAKITTQRERMDNKDEDDGRPYFLDVGI